MQKSPTSKCWWNLGHLGGQQVIAGVPSRRKFADCRDNADFLQKQWSLQQNEDRGEVASHLGGQQVIAGELGGQQVIVGEPSRRKLSKSLRKCRESCENADCSHENRAEGV